MATVNHVRVSNIALDSAATSRSLWWNLTRAMKKSGWKFKASGNGTTKISNSDPAADQLGAGTVSNAGAAAASITAIANGRATVTGLAGIVATDKGKFLLFSGAGTAASNNQHQIEEVLSATSVRIDARNFAVVAPDANNGVITWSVRDPLGDLYSSFSAAIAGTAWWCAQGPSILRIPITAASTGLFIRGEKITQATTLAEGEFLGYIFSAGTGYLVVAPRLRGSGTGVHGWQTGFTITGANSGATVPQSGTAIDYVYEMVYVGAGQLFIGQFDTVADAAEMFSALAVSVATASVAPGGSGTFPTKAWVVWGSAPTTGSSLQLTGSGLFHRAHTICADAIPEAGYSADGSWSLLYSNQQVTASPSGFNVFGFQRLNDTEDGDLAPYVSLYPTGAVGTRTAGPATPVVNNTDFGQLTFSAVSGWRRRGLTLDTFLTFNTALLTLSGASLASVMSQNAVEMYKIATGTDATARVREPIWLVSTALGTKMYKGTLKWLYWFFGDQATDVYGTDPAWVQIGTGTSGVSTAVIGPADGTAWVLNA